MKDWREGLKFDPLPSLLSSENEALTYLVRRHLLGEEVGPVRALWQLPKARKILKKQRADGSFRYPVKKTETDVNYGLIETWKQFRFLVEMYGFTRDEPSAEKAAEFLFSCQTKDGDFRGFLANQYATYYSGAILSLLIKAGYGDDPRVHQCFEWLLAMRQDDSGWTIPMLTHTFDRETQHRITSTYAEPVEPDRSKPFSHNWTGMVLRAFAAHDEYRRSKAARKAADLLKSRFFQPDCYTSYQAASYWVRFQYPFWWNNLVAALDSISFIDSSQDEQIDEALDWIRDHQQEDGLWKVTYVKGKKTENSKTQETQLWVTLAICRVFKRFSRKPQLL